MAWVERPRRRADGSYWTRVRERIGGRGSALAAPELVEAATEQDCLLLAGAAKVKLEDLKRRGQLKPANGQPPRVRSGGISWDGLIVKWMKLHVYAQNKGATLNQYPGLMARYVSALLGGRIVANETALSGLEWRELVREIAAGGQHDPAGRPMANKMVAIVKGMLRWAEKNDLIPEDHPWLDLEPYDYEPPTEEADYAPTPEHIELFRAIFLHAQFCFGPHDLLKRRHNALIVSLLGHEGFRQEDLDAHWHHAVAADGTARTFFEIPEGKTRAAKRSPELWLPVRAEMQLVYNLSGHPSGPTAFLAGRRGGSFSRHNWRRDAWEEAAIIATAVDLTSLAQAKLLPSDVIDIPHFIRPHLLRRGAASMMAYAGIPRAVVIRHLGHEDDKTLLHFYERPYKGGAWRQGKSMKKQIRAARQAIHSTAILEAIRGAEHKTLKLRRERAEGIIEAQREAGRRAYQKRKNAALAERTSLQIASKG